MIDWNQLYHYQKVMTVWQWGFAILIVSLAIWSIVRLKSYFREDADDADQTLEMLTQFRELHQEGGLSNDEFRLIRSRLTRIAQEELGAPQTKQTEKSAERVSTQSKDAQYEAPSQSPAQDAMTEKEAGSERITDNQTG